MKNIKRHHKIAAAAGFTAVTCLSLIGGTLAEFSDQTDVPSTGVLSAGSVEISATTGANFTDPVALAIGDTFSRTFTIVNDSTIPVTALKFKGVATEVSPGLGASLAAAVNVDVLLDGNYASSFNLDQLASGFSNGATIAPGDDVVVTLNYTMIGDGGPHGFGEWMSGERTDFVTNPDNAFQEASASIVYTVGVVQTPGGPVA